MSSRQTPGDYLALCAILWALCSTVIPCCVASRPYTCTLESVPVERIPVKEIAEGIGTRRLLRSGPPMIPAIAIAPDVGLDNDGAEFPEDRSEKPPIVYQEARLCHCAVVNPNTDDEAPYCPLPADRCLVWIPQERLRGPPHGPYRMECFVAPSWKVKLARNVWVYLCFVWPLLLLYWFFSRAGQNAMRYILSKCLPQMNPWIAEHLLRTEIEAYVLACEESERHSRLTRRTEGWISGYRTKTKLYSSGDATTGTIEDNVCKPCDDDDTDKGYDEETCAICITAVEDGDRVADLSCGHLFHTGCLSEWILKKNSCPLCQGPVAQEIRSFDDSLEDVAGDRAGSESVTSRWRRQIRDSLLDVATGRDRRTHAVHRNRMRDMLNGSMEA